MASHNMTDNTRYAEEILSRFESYRSENKLTDVTLIAGNERIDAHKIILCAASDYFATMFMNTNLKESNQREITLQEIDGDILQKLIRYCYTGNIEIDKDTAESVFAAADILLLNEVTKICSKFMEEQIDPSNCIGIYSIAERYHCSELKKKTIEYISNCFAEVSQNAEFLKLSEDEVYQLLSSDYLGVSDEEAIFKALMKWVEYNEPVRSKNIGSLFSAVRLPLLCPEFIINHINVNPILTKDDTCQRLIKEALIYHLLPERETLIEKRQNCIGKGTVFLLYPAGALEWPDVENIIHLQEFNPRANMWLNRKITFPYKGHPHLGAAAIVDTKLYIVSGKDVSTNELLDICCVDLKTKTWSNFPETPSLKRYGHKVAVLDEFLYVVGGKNNDNHLKTVARLGLDFGQPKWEFVKSMIVPQSEAAVTVINNKIYVIGGTEPGHQHGWTTAQSYDPGTNKWTLHTSMNKSRCNPGVGLADGYLYVIGGSTGGQTREIEQSIERYDPEVNSWILIGIMNTACHAFEVAALSNKLFAVGVINTYSYSAAHVEEYDPAKHEIIQLRSRNSPLFRSAKWSRDSFITFVFNSNF